MTFGRGPRARLDLTAAILAGLMAGVVYTLLLMGLLPIEDGSDAWAPLRRVAAMLLGPDVLAPAGFDAGVAGLGLLLNLAFSAVLGAVAAVFLRGWRPLAAALLGLAFGAVLYVVDMYALPAAYPWFALQRGWATLVAHLAFGATIGAVYALRTAPARPATHSRERARRTR